jgi:hypothetical protein
MRWHIRRALALWLACALLISVAPVVGRNRPPSEAVQMLHLVDCALPCWIGIELGQTPFSEGYRRLEDAFGGPVRLEERMGNSRERMLDPSYTGEFDALVPLRTAQGVISLPVQFFVTKGIITSIWIPDVWRYDTPVIPGMPSVGEIVSLLGPPTCVEPSSGRSWGLTYATSFGNLEVGTEPTSLLRWTHSVNLLLFVSAKRFGTQVPIDWCASPSPYRSPWIGLATNERYRGRP